MMMMKLGIHKKKRKGKGETLKLVAYIVYSIYQHHVHGTVSNPTDGVTHSVCEEKHAFCWSYLTSSLEIFHLSSIRLPLIASDSELVEFHIQEIKEIDVAKLGKETNFEGV